jgi:Undecaprenyl-phosphate glucose phosphotransferase
MTFANPHDIVVDSTGSPASAPIGYRYSPEILPGIFRAIDMSAFVVSAGVSSLLFFYPIYTNVNFYAFAVVFCAFMFNIAASKTQLYAHDTLMRYGGRFDDLLLAGMVAVLLFLSVTISLGALEEYEMRWVLSFAGGAFLVQATARLTGCWVLRRMAARRMIGRTMAVLGVGEQTARFLRRLDAAKPFFTDIVGVFDPDPAGVGPRLFHGRPVHVGVDALLAAAREQRIDDIVVTMPWNADRQVSQLVEQLKELPVNVYLSTDLVGYELAFSPVTGDFADLPVFEVVQRPISGWSSLLKTLEDYVLAGAALIVISPILLAIAAAIKLDSPGPVFFKQRRLGFNNQEFQIYKFRSMYHREIPEHVVRQASKDDPRITRVGRIIRKTSLDELPQLFNVLNGTMSLVGPRPHAISHNAEYGRQIRGYFARHKVKPGITGWAQVNGLRGETETLDKMEARIRYDVYYADNWSLFFDIRILVQTVLVVLFQKTAY